MIKTMWPKTHDVGPMTLQGRSPLRHMHSENAAVCQHARERSTS